MVQIVIPLHPTGLRLQDPSSSSSSSSSEDFHVSPEDFVLVELQGSIETEDGESLAGRTVGKMEFTETGVPILRVGHHRLEGKLVNLDKPLALLRSSGSEPQDPTLASPTRGTKRMREPEKRYDVVTVIRRKYLFRDRPDPVIDPVDVKGGIGIANRGT